MTVKIENLTNRPVLIRCNSGMMLHLAPRTISAEIAEVEVKDNPVVQKLKERRVITFPEAETKKGKEESIKGKEKGETTKHHKR